MSGRLARQVAWPADRYRQARLPDRAVPALGLGRSMKRDEYPTHMPWVMSNQ